MNFPPLSISEREKSLRNKKKTIKIDEEYFMHETVSPSGALGVTYTEWRSARLPNIGKKHSNRCFSVICLRCHHKNYFGIKILILRDGNWKFRILITRLEVVGLKRAMGSDAKEDNDEFFSSAKKPISIHREQLAGMLMSECSLILEQFSIPFFFL